jgi:hypothetical protein
MKCVPSKDVHTVFLVEHSGAVSSGRRQCCSGSPCLQGLTGSCISVECCRQYDDGEHFQVTFHIK